MPQTSHIILPLRLGSGCYCATWPGAAAAGSRQPAARAATARAAIWTETGPPHNSHDGRRAL